MGDFVTVSRDKKRLELNGQPFRIVGANSYHVQSHGADFSKPLKERLGIHDPNFLDSGRKNIAELLNGLAKAKINVLRIWAHNEHCEEFTWKEMQDGKEVERKFSNTWKTIQRKPTPDHISRFEPNTDHGLDGLDGLDWAVAQAAKHNIKLIMSLTNYWKDFGGMPQYARWATGNNTGHEHEMQVEFLKKGEAHSMFKAYIKFLLNRENPYNKKLYKNDPTILAWSIANEPRGWDDNSGNRLDDWIKDTAQFIRSHDENHLITVDTEGFFLKDDSNLDIKVDYLNPDERWSGCDFLRNAKHDCIDFACIHMYQEKWAPEKDKTPWQAMDTWIYKWLDTHLAACRSFPKPLVLSEFSEIVHPLSDFKKRRDFLTKVYNWLEEHMKADDFVAGSCVWMICEKAYMKSDSEHRFIAIDGGGDDGIKEVLKHAEQFQDHRLWHDEL